MEDSEKVKQVVEKLRQDPASAKAQEIGAPQVVATISGALLEEGAGTEVSWSLGLHSAWCGRESQGRYILNTSQFQYHSLNRCLA